VAEDRISVVYDGVPVLTAREPGSEILALQKGSTLAGEAARAAGVALTIATDMEHDLSRAAMLVYITQAEGLGSALLLAMSAGVPVIASNVGGVPEVVRDRETGLLVENQPEAIAAAIRELLGNPELARLLATEGRRSVLERFTVEHMVRRTMEVYRQVLV
jgi:glycosyltransferase involved in cell wall biosynthesis